MFLIIKWQTAVFSISVVFATISAKRTGWLDRVVQFHKANFIKDVQEVAPIQVEAQIQSRPLGYVEASGWDFDSVARLLILIAESEASRPVHLALRRMLNFQPTRRQAWVRELTKQESFRYIPSLQKYYGGNFYYDMYTFETYYEPKMLSKNQDAILVVQNPVEARLPSAQISVKLLKEILMNRALAAREMPTTQKSTILWIPMNKTVKTMEPDLSETTSEAEGETIAEMEGETIAEKEPKTTAEKSN